MHNFQDRIEFKGDLVELLKPVCIDFSIGNFKSYNIIQIGYEDLNVAVETDTGKYLVKLFNSYRDFDECKRYVDIMVAVVNAGISHPKIYFSNQGALHQVNIEDRTIRLCVLQFIDGSSFYQLGVQPTVDELSFLAKQAAIINQLSINPFFLLDGWACTNFLNEYESKKMYLVPEDKILIDKVADDFSKIDLETLPKAFVHGDIIKTNVIRGDDGKIYIIDFAVSNVYPRIQELAVLLCDLFFNEKDPSKFPELYELGLNEYQKINPLTENELSILPLYIKVAHSIHILLPTYLRKVENNNSSENDLWLNLGKVGLRYANSLWAK